MWVVHVYTLVSRCFSLNCEVPLPGGCCSQKNESPLSFLNYLFSERDLFCLSLAVHYRPLGLCVGLCAWCCIRNGLLIADGLQGSATPWFLLPLFVALPSSAPGLQWLLHPIHPGQGNPWAGGEPRPFPLLTAHLQLLLGESCSCPSSLRAGLASCGTPMLCMAGACGARCVCCINPGY